MKNEKEHLYRLFILTPEFRRHLCILTALNMPCRTSLNEYRNLTNLTKGEVLVQVSSTSRHQTNV